MRYSEPPNHGDLLAGASGAMELCNEHGKRENEFINVNAQCIPVNPFASSACASVVT